MATVLEFPIVKLASSRNRWPADEDLHAEIIELSDFRPLPVDRGREWQAFMPFNTSLALD
jgi:hypothetical protein